MELLSRHHVAGTHQERSEYLEGLFGKADLQTVPTKLAGLTVELEDAEAKHVRARREIHGTLTRRSECNPFSRAIPLSPESKRLFRRDLISDIETSLRPLSPRREPGHRGDAGTSYTDRRIE